MTKTKSELIDVLKKELKSFFDTTGICVTEIDISWLKNPNMHTVRDVANIDIKAE